MSDPISELKELYPVWEFQNKSGQPQLVTLDNDTVPVAIRGTLKLPSSHFLNLPSTSLFKFVTPTLDDLRAVGLIKTVEVKTASETPAPTSGSTGKNSSKSTSSSSSADGKPASDNPESNGA